MSAPAASTAPPLDARIWSCAEPVVFFPVRHHSPACARLIAELLHALRPAAVLIEGPSDFNSRLREFAAPHQLPIAIYSYFSLADGTKRGAFYPFCDFSPEWIALRTGLELGAHVEFIDLPWVDVAPLDRIANRYADGQLGRSPYTAELCRRLGVDDWNALWDTLFEIERELNVADFLQRCHTFCHSARVAEEGASAADLAREAHMLTAIRAAVARGRGPIVVVTGGFHSPALFAGLHGRAFEPVLTNATDEPAGDEPRPPVTDRGLALTPYSYERLDALTGYNAGLPNPGFYHRVWLNRLQPSPSQHPAHHALLMDATTALRERGQIASTADLIGVETFAQGIATLRGHTTVWRTDLVDALLGTLVKEEFAAGGRHPFLDALHQVFRGSARGQLAPGTPLPPLVENIAQTLQEHGLELSSHERRIELKLEQPVDRARSHILHQARILALPGFRRTGGTDFVSRRDLVRLWETWVLRWSPEFDAACIENTVYGATLLEAAAARLVEQAAKLERDAEAAARLLLDASLAGWDSGFGVLHDRMVALLRADAAFTSVARALEHLFYLYRYDETVTQQSRSEVAALLTEAYARGIWLLEAQAPSADDKTLHGLAALLRAVHTAGETLGWDCTELLGVLQRLAAAAETPALLRGAAAGALWSLGASDVTGILDTLTADPDQLGDFLHGVFALAREEAQRSPNLLVTIDRLLLTLDDEQFLVALPALRLAFTYFTPREKDHLARRLLAAVGETDSAPLPALAVTAEIAARALAIESRLQRELDQHGLRGGSAPIP